MSFSDFKEKLLTNTKGLNKKKYLIYLSVMIIFSIFLWATTGNVSSAIFMIVLFLFIVTVDLLFDLLGYFKNTKATKEMPIAKKILGYIIGTIIFIIIGIILLRIIEFFF